MLLLTRRSLPRLGPSASDLHSSSSFRLAQARPSSRSTTSCSKACAGFRNNSRPSSLNVSNSSLRRSNSPHRRSNAETEALRPASTNPRLPFTCDATSSRTTHALARAKDSTSGPRGPLATRVCFCARTSTTTGTTGAASKSSSLYQAVDRHNGINVRCVQRHLILMNIEVINSFGPELLPIDKSGPVSSEAGLSSPFNRDMGKSGIRAHVSISDHVAGQILRRDLGVRWICYSWHGLVMVVPTNAHAW